MPDIPIWIFCYALSVDNQVLFTCRKLSNLYISSPVSLCCLFFFCHLFTMQHYFGCNLFHGNCYNLSKARRKEFLFKDITCIISHLSVSNALSL